MIRDLAALSGANERRTADVLVIGGGIAGLLAAVRLSRAGVRVIVAESGGLTQPTDTHPLNAVEQDGDVYAGADSGRFRCLGGTSSRWGGAMLPFLPDDMTLTRPGDPVWPIGPEVLTAYLGEVERLFGLGDGPYDRPALMPGPFVPRWAKWPPFRLRNVATVFGAELRAERGPEVWLNATATDFSTDPQGRLDRVTVRSPGGGILSVAASEVVVAAGTIESTRLLLLADRQHDDRIFAPDDVLGRWFHDHVSVATARLVDVDRPALNRVVGFGFEGRAMRNLRFEPGAALRRDRGLPAGFVHIGFSSATPGGFEALRDVYRKVQRREVPGLADVSGLARAVPWLARAAWWRFVERRLLFPDGAELAVNVVVEQRPRPDNRITLSSQRLDALGSPLARIAWRVHEDDAAHVAAITEAFASAWNAGRLSSLARVVPALPTDLRGALAAGGGIYHPGGSVRMGFDPASGVVDADLKTFRIPNVTVLSTAVFPTGGGANPTMMLMMAALRAADRLSRTCAGAAVTTVATHDAQRDRDHAGTPSLVG
ncbi:GMC oxidoreductase [Rhodoplanes azumiensis]|uniref:GMC oxidoreductase n=1 Tax=Rhodoplanes azumiensis TaxID=1897628 RepID=A0ABW5AL30_9BRAD